jgi:hypothetical protein
MTMNDHFGDDEDVAEARAHSLAEDYPREQARLRELIAEYRALGPVGSFGAVAIESVLREADRASAAGDLAAMVIAYSRMKECC